MQENLNYYEEFAENILKNLKKEQYIKITNDKKHNMVTTKVNIVNSKLSNQLNKKRGIYYSVRCDNFNFFESSSYICIANKISKILSEIKATCVNNSNFSVLVVGLGNSNVLCDSLGVKTIDKLIVPTDFEKKEFNNLFRKVFSFCPSIYTKTGVQTADLVSAIVKKIKPSFVILIDTLTCKDERLIGKCFQVNNVGLKPGGSFSNSKWIDKKLLGIPVVAIGVPLVTNFSNILGKKSDYNYYTDKNIDEIINKWSFVLGLGLNKFLQNKLATNDILFYMS